MNRELCSSEVYPFTLIHTSCINIPGIAVFLCLVHHGDYMWQVVHDPSWWSLRDFKINEYLRLRELLKSNRYV